MPRRTKNHCTSLKSLREQAGQSRPACITRSAKRAFTECGSALPDLKGRLIASGTYEQYIAWREAYFVWRKGNARGAKGEATSDLQSSVWREAYHQWRRGAQKGAKGEAGVAQASPHGMPEGVSVVYDIVADEHGQPTLLPTDGPSVSGMRIDEFPSDALLTIRVFRFFESRRDETEVWEQQLRNVNSGSLAWVPAHLAPGMHSMSGAKYGTWFTVHYIQVYAKHFSSCYHMANDGWSAAKSFGSARQDRTIQGQPLNGGYFWFVSPADSNDSSSAVIHLKHSGWKHLGREGPFDGNQFLAEWQKRGSLLSARDLQSVLEKVRCQSSM